METDKESLYGFVYAVSGPGMFFAPMIRNGLYEHAKLVTPLETFVNALKIELFFFFPEFNILSVHTGKQYKN